MRRAAASPRRRPAPRSTTVRAPPASTSDSSGREPSGSRRHAAYRAAWPSAADGALGQVEDGRPAGAEHGVARPARRATTTATGRSGCRSTTGASAASVAGTSLARVAATTTRTASTSPLAAIASDRRGERLAVWRAAPEVERVVTAGRVGHDARTARLAVAGSAAAP